MEQILVVDDEQKVRATFRTVLTDAGYQVLEAADAEEATEVLLRNKVDLILLDINMPEIDGKVMNEVILEFGNKPKVLIASVYPLSQQMKMVPGVDGYFDKSQGPDILLEKVKNVLPETNKGYSSETKR